MNIQVPGNASGSASAFQSFELNIKPFSGKEFHVTAIDGREEMSDLYAFDVWFTCTDILDAPEAAGQPVSIELYTGAGSLVVAGVVTQFDCDDPTPLGDFSYHLVIGPHFALTQLSRQNQVYGTGTPVTVADVIRGKLTNSFSADSTSGGANQQVAFDLRIMGDYPQRDHVAQFEESDFTFLSRTCEHHGVFYFFEHAKGGETIVFGDGNVSFQAAEGASSLPFRATRGQADDISVSSFRATAKPVTGTIYVRDYDDMQASTELLASHTIDGNGFGAVVEYGPNFNSMSIGNRFAQVRAEEQAAQRVVYHGISTAPGLRPGTFFTLTNHPNHSLNGRYIVVSVRHSAGDSLTRTGPYENRFEAIAFGTPYRPRRKTPRPSVGGLFNATIDSAGAGQRSDLDSNGRYKLRHVYDESRSPPGQASAYVHKAQPYAGKADTGFHMPLLKDTGVLVGYVNGDPDRPRILGAVPSSTTPSVATQTNQLINRLRTPSGGLLELNDGPASGGGGVSPYTRLVAQSALLTDFPDSSYIRLGGYVADESALLPTAASPQPTVTSSTVSSLQTGADTYLSNSLATAKEPGHQETSDQSQGNTQTNKENKLTITPTAIKPSGAGVLLYSDHDLLVNTLGAAFAKYGAGHGTVVATGDGAYNVPAGQYTLTAQNGVSITAGSASASADINLTAYNYINQKAYGPLSEITYGDSYKNVHGDATELFLGTKNTWVTDAEISGKIAASMTLFMGISSTIKLSVEVNITMALAITFKLVGEMTITGPFKWDVVLGFDWKTVIGAACKTVIGADVSTITTGLKTVTGGDVKIVTGVDFKEVTVDSKYCQAFLEMKGIDLAKTQVSIKNDGLRTAVSNLQVKMCNADMKQAEIVVVT